MHPTNASYAKWQKTLAKEAEELISTLAIIFISVIIHEAGHYVVAQYYNLEPLLGVDKNALYVEANKSTPEINWIIDRAGPVANLLFAFVAVFLREYMVIKRKKIPFSLIIFIASNIIIAFIALIMFPHT